MKVYLRTVNLKLGLIVFAVLIALASLLYTNSLVHRLRESESAGMEIWAGAREQVARAATSNPYQEEFRQLSLAHSSDDPFVGSSERMRDALGWASRMPLGDHIDFFFDVISDYYTDVPAIITDSLRQPQSWHNLAVSDRGPFSSADSQYVQKRLEQMAATYDPIPIKVDFDDPQGDLKQYVYYDESEFIRELRIFPYLQLLFVGLFITVGYLGFSYVRRSEQSSLWVGMAREAAHQLGTPISSLMGWLEIMRQGVNYPQHTVDEIARDVQRLSRVAHRFSDIGSMPRLVPMQLAPCITGTADYIRTRLPQQGITLTVDVPAELRAPLNAHLFEWVIENLLKNALDAIESAGGVIRISAKAEGARIYIDIRDNGKGIDRRQRKNVFRPGYSTKKRGWGLGLSLAKRIVEDYHGGALTLAQSKPGQGATFRVELPMAADA